MPMTREHAYNASAYAPPIRLLRGRALLRRHAEELGEYRLPSGIVVPGNVDPCRNDGDKQFGERPTREIHRGLVLALGPPAWEHEREGVERDWVCKPGDEVFYVYALARINKRTFTDLVFVAHEEIIMVVE